MEQIGQASNTLKTFIFAQHLFSYTPSLKPFPNIHCFLLPLDDGGRVCAVPRERLMHAFSQ